MKMKNYRIPVIWKCTGYVNTHKSNLKDAIAFALDPDTPLPDNREFVQDSLEIDKGRLYADARDHYPDSDAEYIEKLFYGDGSRKE